METIKGKTVLPGYAQGKIWCVQKRNLEAFKVHKNAVTNEVVRFNNAINAAIKNLDILYQNASREGWREIAELYKIHEIMMRDELFTGEITNTILTRCVTAEFAVMETRDNLVAQFMDANDDYLKERTTDIKDVAERILRALKESAPTQNEDVKYKYAQSKLNGAKSVADVRFLKTPSIIMAGELTPTDMMQFDRTKVLGIVVKDINPNSNTILLAKSMRIPIISGVDYYEGYNGKDAVMDTANGVLYIDPTDETMSSLSKIRKRIEEDIAKYMKFRLSSDETLLKKSVPINVNINSADEIDVIQLDNPAGIGLFRSEMFFLSKEDCPTEEEQFELYKNLAIKMGKRRVIIRTTDFSNDKLPSYLNIDEKACGALGLRGVLSCMRDPKLLETQIRAIMRASVYGNIAMAFPNVSSPVELTKINDMIGRIRKEFFRNNIVHKPVEIGITIETPAAVLISDVLTKDVDFVILDIDNLTQYTLAIDKTNDYTADYFNSRHLSVLRAMQMATKNAHKNDCNVIACSENESDISAVDVFIKMGIDEFSVSPAAILKTRKAVNSSKL